MRAKLLPRYGIMAVVMATSVWLAMQMWFIAASSNTAQEIDTSLSRLKRARDAIALFRHDNPGEALGPRWTERLARYDPGFPAAVRAEASRGGTGLAITLDAMSRSIDELPERSVVLVEHRSSAANPVVPASRVDEGLPDGPYVGVLYADGTLTRVGRSQLMRMLERRDNR